MNRAEQPATEWTAMSSTKQRPDGLLIGALAIGLLAFVVILVARMAYAPAPVINGHPGLLNAQTGNSLAPELPQPAGAQACTSAESAPTGSSPAAIAYLRAVHTVEPGYFEVSQAIALENGIIHRNDLINTLALNRTFVSEVDAIHFPADAAASARDLVTDIEQSDTLLKTSIAQLGYYAANQQRENALLSARGDDTALLRTKLNLPPSLCVLTRA